MPKILLLANGQSQGPNSAYWVLNWGHFHYNMTITSSFQGITVGTGQVRDEERTLLLDPLGPASSPTCWGDHSSTEKHQMKVGGGRCKSGHAGLHGKLEKPQLELEKGVQVFYVDMSPVPSRLAPDWSKGTQSSLLPDLCEFKECLQL